LLAELEVTFSARLGPEMPVATNSVLTDQRLPKVLCSAASGLTSFLRELGRDPDAISGPVSLDPAKIDQSYSEMTLAQFCALFEMAALSTRFDYLGLMFGHGFVPKKLGALGYATVRAPTLGAGLADLCHYFSAHQQATMLRLRIAAENGYLEYRIRDARVGPSRQNAELSLAVFQNTFRSALGKKWSPMEVHFEHSRRGGLKYYSQVFSAPVYFEQRINSLAFRVQALDALMPEPDPYLVSVRRTRPAARPGCSASRIDQCGTSSIYSAKTGAMPRSLSYRGTAPSPNR
jgi:hypothetical protein